MPVYVLRPTLFAVRTCCRGMTLSPGDSSAQLTSLSPFNRVQVCKPQKRDVAWWHHAVQMVVMNMRARDGPALRAVALAMQIS